ncbi:MAG: GNAT family N-acetyltransferase [Synergistales bacterium]|nr:GNAT family N-acetyltransferase [Synergistales bacterium]
MDIRQMGRSDLDFASFCTETEGWDSEVREVFEGFHTFFPRGCLIAEKEGKPAGIIVATPYIDHGFIGELIVLQGYRGHGIGTALLSRALDVLRERGIRTILLDGDLKAVPIYERGGFRRICRSLRFNGSIICEMNGAIRPMSLRDLALIYDIDRELFGDDRSFFLEKCLRNYPRYCLVEEKKGRITGYLFGRKGKGLIVAGPWAVLQRGDPMAMMEGLSFVAKGIPLRIGVLENNLEAVRLMRSLDGFQEEEFSWRMEWGLPSGLGDNPCLFGIGSAARG